MTDKNENTKLRNQFSKDNDNKPTMKNAVIDWVSSTNIHGLPHLVNREHNFKKVMWFILSVAALSFLVSQLFTMIVKFYSYPTKTVTMRIPLKSVNFPAVSFCDMNIISRHQLSSENFTYLREKFDGILLDDLTGDYYKGEMGKKPTKFVSKVPTTTLWKSTSKTSNTDNDSKSTVSRSNAPGSLTTPHRQVESSAGPVSSFNTQTLQKRTSKNIIHTQHFIKSLTTGQYTTGRENRRTSSTNIPTSQYEERFYSSWPTEFTSTDFYSTEGSSNLNREKRKRVKTSRTLEEYWDREFDPKFISSSFESDDTYFMKKSLPNGEIKTKLTLRKNNGTKKRTILQNDELNIRQNTPDKYVWRELGNWNHELDNKIYRKEEIQHINKREDHSTESSRSEKQSKVRKIYADLKEKEKEYLGKQIEDLVHEVTFLGQTFKLNDFDHFLSPKYGNCYTFNSGSKNILKVQETGPGIGLDITLSVNEFDYLPTLSETVGIIMVIHDQKVMPFPMSEGYSLSPGFDIKIGLNLFMRELAGHPYGPCKNVSDVENYRINAYTDMLPKVNYTFRACYATCMQKRIIKKCACIYPFLNFDSKFFNLTNNHTAICDIDRKMADESPNYKCALEAITKTEHSFCSSMCPQDCLTYKYEPTFSFARWPSKPYYEAILKNEISHKFKQMGINESDFDEEYVRHNYMKVSVYFENMELLYVRTEASYDLFDMLSDLGGQLGLWMGISLLTIAEIFELLYDVTFDEVARRISRS